MLLDLGSRRLLGYQLSGRIDARLVADAFFSCPKRELIHRRGHPDRATVRLCHQTTQRGELLSSSQSKRRANVLVGSKGADLMQRTALRQHWTPTASRRYRPTSAQSFSSRLVLVAVMVIAAGPQALQLVQRKCSRATERGLGNWWRASPSAECVGAVGAARDAGSTQ